MNKFCMRKLPVGERIYSRESKYKERCCSCYANCETDNHLLQCPKRKRHRNEIMQAVNCLGKEMDPRLHNILRDGINKYLKGEEQTVYKTPGKEEYHQLQTDQNKIGWDNLIRGKFSKHWRIHTEKQTRQGDTGNEQRIYANNRTSKEEEVEDREIGHQTETQNRRLPTTICHNYQHCTRTMA